MEQTNEEEERSLHLYMVKVGLCAFPVCTVVYQCFLGKIQVQNYSGCPLQAFDVWDISNRTVVNQLQCVRSLNLV